MTSVVAIGASAGGVTAVAAVLASLPNDFPAAVLVVQHLDPHGQSYLAPVLARECRLPVRNAVAGESITAGTVYVGPPGVHLAVRDGQVALSDAAPVHYARPSVDVLFRSIADACGPSAVAQPDLELAAASAARAARHDRAVVRALEELVALLADLEVDARRHGRDEGGGPHDERIARARDHARRIRAVLEENDPVVLRTDG